VPTPTGRLNDFPRPDVVTPSIVTRNGKNTSLIGNPVTSSRTVDTQVTRSVHTRARLQIPPTHGSFTSFKTNDDNILGTADADAVVFTLQFTVYSPTPSDAIGQR